MVSVIVNIQQKLMFDKEDVIIMTLFIFLPIIYAIKHIGTIRYTIRMLWTLITLSIRLLRNWVVNLSRPIRPLETY